MLPRALALVVLALLALPGLAQGHAGEDHSTPTPTPAPQPPREPAREIPVPEGYTGAGREPYLSYFEGTWLYGQMIATPLAQQFPIDLDVDGDWLVWEDAARSDIFAYSISASQGYYVTSDAVPQQNPRVSQNVIVYEDYATPYTPRIMAYFLDTGEIRPLSPEGARVHSPSIDYPIVAWVDENRTNPDIWAYSLVNNTAWNVAAGTDRDSDPVVLGDTIYWRTFRYNLWDILAHDVTLERTRQVTSDTEIQGAPFTNGKDVLFLTNHLELAWRLDRHDVATESVRRTNILLSDARTPSASGDALLRVAEDVDYQQLVVRNISSGATNHITGNLLLVSSPVLQDRTVFAAVRTKLGTSLLVLEVSSFAFAKRPALTITSPSNGIPWVRPVNVAGLLEMPAGFTEPTTFTYRIDDGPPQIIPPGRSWRVTLDPSGQDVGDHILTVRATFLEGPPVTASLRLVVPAATSELDVGGLGPAFHAARVAGEFNIYVLSNPASWFLIPLVLILLAVVAVRVWLWAAPKRRRVVAEYVVPDDA